MAWSLENQRAWRAANPERCAKYAENTPEKKAQRRAWYLANKEKAYAQSKKWREENRDKVRAMWKKQRDKNREQRSEYTKQWIANNPERYKELKLKASRQWAANNPSLSRAIKRDWEQRNPHKVYENKMRRRSFERNALVQWADQELLELIYAEARRRRMHVDHIIPLRGKNVCGLHVHTNLQLLHPAENSRKGNRWSQT